MFVCLQVRNLYSMELTQEQDGLPDIQRHCIRNQEQEEHPVQRLHSILGINPLLEWHVLQMENTSVLEDLQTIQMDLLVLILVNPGQRLKRHLLTEMELPLWIWTTVESIHW